MPSVGELAAFRSEGDFSSHRMEDTAHWPPLSQAIVYTGPYDLDQPFFGGLDSPADPNAFAGNLLPESYRLSAEV